MNGILNQSTVVKQYELIDPLIDEVDYLLDKVKKDCRKNNFIRLNLCVYHLKFTKKKNNEEVILPVSLGYMEFKSEYYGLNVKIEKARNKGFLINEIIKLTMKIYSNQSNINIQ